MLYSIPAHRSTVSDVKFFKAEDGLKEFPKTVIDKKTEPAKPNGITNGHAEPAVKQEEEEEDIKPDISGMDMDTAEQKPAPVAAGWGRTAQPEVPISGMYLASAGYDGYVKLWSADDWQLVKSLNSEAGGKVMSVDLSGGESTRISPAAKCGADEAFCETLQTGNSSQLESGQEPSSCSARQM